MKTKTSTQIKRLEAENQYLWGKIAEMEQNQLKLLIELTEPKPEVTIGNFFRRKNTAV